MANPRNDYGTNNRNDGRFDSDRNRRGRSSYSSSRDGFTGDEYRSDDLRFDTDYDRNRMESDREFNGGNDHSYGRFDRYDRFDRNERGVSGAMGTSPWQGSSYGTRDSSSRMNHQGKGPKGWKRSDERIREDVSERLERDSHVDASEIEVSVKDGVVTLSGKVEDRYSKRQAEDLIENMTGVKDVKNELSIDQNIFSQNRETYSAETYAGKSTGKTAPH